MMKFALEEKGQGTVEFVIILLLVVFVVAVVSIMVNGATVNKVFSTGSASL